MPGQVHVGRKRLGLHAVVNTIVLNVPVTLPFHHRREPAVFRTWRNRPGIQHDRRPGRDPGETIIRDRRRPTRDVLAERKEGVVTMRIAAGRRVAQMTQLGEHRIDINQRTHWNLFHPRPQRIRHCRQAQQHIRRCTYIVHPCCAGT